MNVQFEVERFEWAADDRLELEGRWFGLRGRRFVRPTLDVEVDGESRRLLALMEHKPWAALDGEDWHAAFAWDGDRGEIDAQLAVGGDLTFELPRPGATGAATPKRGHPSQGHPSQGHPSQGQPSQGHPSRDAALERRLAEAERARVELAGDVQALHRAVAQKERTVRELEHTLSQVRAEAAAAVAARAAVVGHVEQAQHERYEAQGTTAAAEREAAAALRARDEAQAAADAARDAARVARAERDTMRRERDAAVSERDAALARLERASHNLDVARAERPRVGAVAEVVRRRGPQALAWLHRERSRDEMLAMRFAALATLSVVCLLVAAWILIAAA